MSSSYIFYIEYNSPGILCFVLLHFVRLYLIQLYLFQFIQLYISTLTSLWTLYFVLQYFVWLCIPTYFIQQSIHTLTEYVNILCPTMYTYFVRLHFVRLHFIRLHFVWHRREIIDINNNLLIEIK
jgi:hypothetical protein